MTARPTLLASHLAPTLGLEACVLRLVDELGGDLDLVVIGESAERIEHVDRPVEILGAPLRGWRRLASVPRLRRWLRGRRGTIVVAGAWAAIPLLLARPPRDIRVVVWEHSFSREKTGSAPGLRLLSSVARIAYRRADLVVCVSDDLRSQVAQWARRTRLVTIPNYLPRAGAGGPARPAEVADPPPAGVPDVPRGCRLLSVGSLSATKNHRLLLEAVRLMDESCVLAVAGDGPLRAELEGLVAEWGLTGRVRFLGHTRDVDALYRWCDVVVQPAWGETFGLAMFEAAEHHRPVVSLDYDLARSLVPEAIVGTLVAATPSAVAAAAGAWCAAAPDAHLFAAADARRAVAFDAGHITQMWRSVLLTTNADEPMGVV